MNNKLKVRDVQTGEVFDVDPSADRVNIRTRDGQNVKVYPSAVCVMVRKGQKFDGVTPKGPRLLELMR